MQFTFTSAVDAFEVEEDRLAVKFESKVGYYWVGTDREELLASLRGSLHSGRPVQVTFDTRAREITDVKPL